jgi:hypothetical protein
MRRHYDRRMVAASVVGVVGGVIAAIVIANSEPDADMMGLCSNAAGDRIDDSQCGDWDENGNATTPALPGNYFMWIDTTAYSSGRVPAMGERITVGSRSLPKGRPAAKGAPTTGGNVAEIKRGGFGVKSGSTGGAKSGGGSGGSSGSGSSAGS